MFKEVHCKRCGKNFIPAPQHIYRDNRSIYCSWTCYLHRNDNKKTAFKTKKVGQYTPCGDLIRIYESAKDASAITGYETKRIRMACLQRFIYFGYQWRYEE